LSNAFIYETNVRFSDTDMYGIVHHANFFKLLEEARFQMVEEALELSLDMLIKEGLTFPVTTISGKFKKSLFAREKVSVALVMYYNNSSRITFEYKVLNENGVVCFQGKTEHVCLINQVLSLSLPSLLQECIQSKKEKLECIIYKE